MNKNWFGVTRPFAIGSKTHLVALAVVGLSLAACAENMWRDITLHVEEPAATGVGSAFVSVLASYRSLEQQEPTGLEARFRTCQLSEANKLNTLPCVGFLLFLR